MQTLNQRLLKWHMRSPCLNMTKDHQVAEERDQMWFNNQGSSRNFKIKSKIKWYYAVFLWIDITQTKLPLFLPVVSVYYVVCCFKFHEYFCVWLNGERLAWNSSADSGEAVVTSSEPVELLVVICWYKLIKHFWLIGKGKLFKTAIKKSGIRLDILKTILKRQNFIGQVWMLWLRQSIGLATKQTVWWLFNL